MNFRVKKSEETFKSIVDENGNEIAIVWSAYSGDVEATARLFAAAPELLEALEFLVFAFESCDETGYVDGHGFIDTEDLKEKARQAIAKAKGE